MIYKIHCIKNLQKYIFYKDYNNIGNAILYIKNSIPILTLLDINDKYKNKGNSKIMLNIIEHNLQYKFYNNIYLNLWIKDKCYLNTENKFKKLNYKTLYTNNIFIDDGEYIYYNLKMKKSLF